MRIRDVRVNNRKRAFEVVTDDGNLDFPFADLDVTPTPEDSIVDVFPDPELGHDGFTYRLRSGREDTVLLDQVLDYNRDPFYHIKTVLYKLSLEAQNAVAHSPLSKRELIRRLGTSGSQFYRLLDQTNYSKSVGQLIALLHLTGCDVDITVAPARQKRHGIAADQRRKKRGPGTKISRRS